VSAAVEGRSISALGLIAVWLVLAGCAATTPGPIRIRVTLDPSGVESGPHFDVVLLLVNDPVAVPRSVRELFEGTDSSVVFDLHDAPVAREGLPFESRYGRRVAGGPYRVSGWSVQLFPRDRAVTRELEVAPDCVHLFVAVSPIGGVYGPFAVAGGAGRTVRLSGRGGEFHVPIVIP